jgi:PAS domain S-box-containing protein
MRSEQKLVVAMGLLFGVIVVTCGLAMRNAAYLYDTARAVAQSHEVTQAAGRVLSNVKDAETGQRGYLLTGEESYLQPYDIGVQTVQASLARLDSLVRRDSEQQVVLPELRGVVGRKLAELNRSIRFREDSGFNAARRVVVTDEGRLLMDSVRSIVGTIQARETEVLAQRAVVAARSRTTALLSSLICGLVGVVLVWGCVALWRRDRDARTRAASTLAAEKELFRTTLASIGDGVITTDPAGNVTFLNDVAQKLTGWTADAARGEPLDRVFSIVNEETRRPVENPALRALREGVIVGLANHTTLLGRDGLEHPIDDSAAPIRDESGRVRGTVLVFRDIAERKRVERDLLEADRRKDQFLAVLAHELRNPLAPLQNALEIVQLPGVPPDAVTEFTAMMERQVAQMKRLIDDLLDVSRITRGRLVLQKERTELGAIVASALETVAPEIRQRGHELSVLIPDEPIYVDADRLRFSQAIANVLHNAAKYTEQRGRIALTVESRGSDAIIRVKDTGIGLTTDAMQRIFDMFGQADRSLGRTGGGLGIGLWLVRHLLALHGGSIEVSSPGPGQGSEFTLRLPRVPAPRAAAASPAARPASATNGAVSHKIVVADDHRDGADSLAELLRLRGHEVFVCYDGQAAVDLVGSVHPDVVLLDIGMPLLNGYEAARRIRQDTGASDILLIALTGWGQAEARRQSEESGFDHHLVKPVDLAMFDALLGARPGAQEGATR